MKGNEKLDYSKGRTLNNMGKGYSFELISKVVALGIDDEKFQKGDIIIIDEITLKKDKPHHVVFSIKRDGNIIDSREMSGGIFLKNFISHIEKEDIILKHQDHNKDKVENIIKKD